MEKPFLLYGSITLTGPHLQATRTIANYSFESEMLLSLLIVALLLFSPLSVIFNDSINIMLALLMLIIAVWISVIAFLSIVRKQKIITTPADDVFIAAGVSILISSLALSLIAISQFAIIKLFVILGWLYAQALAAGIVFYALNRYFQIIQQHLRKPSGVMKKLEWATLLAFFALISISTLSIVIAGPETTGSAIGAAAIIVLRGASVFIMLQVLSISKSTQMKSIMASLAIGIVISSIGDLLFSFITIRGTTGFPVATITTHILGLFFILLSSISFQRWGSSPSEIEKLFQRLIELVTSGVRNLAERTRA